MSLKSRAQSLVSRALQQPEGNDPPITLELCELIRRGGCQEVMEALKDPLKHQPPAVQLRALGCVNACVMNSGPELANYISGEEWMERFYKIAKEGTERVRDSVITLVIQWSRRFATNEFRVNGEERFKRSKSLGEHFGKIKQAIESGATAPRTPASTTGSNLPNSRPQHVDPQPQSVSSNNQRKRQEQMSRLEAFLLEAQSDVSGLMYHIENPGPEMDAAAKECQRHKSKVDRLLSQPELNLPEDVTEQLVQLTTELEELLGLYSAISGMGQEGAPLVNETSTTGLESENSTTLPRQESSRNAQRELAQLQVEAQTVKMLEEERKETQKLREELSKKVEELEHQQSKYKEAKKKNQKAVDAASELVEKLEAAEAQIAQLKTGKEQAEELAALPPPEPKIVKVMEKPQVDTAVLESVRTNLSSIKRGFRGVRDDVGDLRKELNLIIGQVASSVNHIVSASEADREGDLKALRWTQELYKKEQKLRKQYYNTIQDLKGNIRVYCRIRPMSKTELTGGHTSIVSFPNDDEIKITDDKGKVRSFEFDSVFSPDSTQEQVFHDTAPLIDSVVDGYNVCIFAYGQTGSGKTHTMTGYDDAKGINRRAIDRLFAIISERQDTEKSTVHVSVVEVYCEQLRDLLRSKAENQATSLDIRTNGPYGNYVNNLSEVDVHSPEDIEAILATASKNRSEGVTKMNQHSSRSHMLLYVRVQTENVSTGAKSYGKLSLVDLAGSERLDKSEATGQGAKEAAAINKSLSALGDVISGLSSQAKHVPFRNSQLTFLLQDSMQGQAKVLMFCCASPASYNAAETNTSLQFATRARGVALGPIKKNAAH